MANDVSPEVVKALAPSGTLRVDLPIVLGRRWILPVLATLSEAHPALSLDIRLQDGFADLVRDGIDVAIRAGELTAADAWRGLPITIRRSGGHRGAVPAYISSGSFRIGPLSSRARAQAALFPTPTKVSIGSRSRCSVGKQPVARDRPWRADPSVTSMKELHAPLETKPRIVCLRPPPPLSPNSVAASACDRFA